MKKLLLMFLLIITILLSGCSLTSKGLESNINPDTGDEYRNVDLVNYSCFGDSETVKKLLRLGLDHLLDEALICALDSNDLETVKALVKEGANIEWSNEDGETALLYALDRQSYNLIEYLLDMGLDPYKTNNEGENIIQYLLNPFLYNRYDMEKDSIALFDTLKIFKEQGIDIESMEIKNGLFKHETVSPLIYSIKFYIPLVTHALLWAGFEIDFSDENELEVIEDYNYILGGSGNQRLISCMLNTYIHPSFIYISSFETESCESMFEYYYEVVPFDKPIGTYLNASNSYYTGEDLVQDVDEESFQEDAEESYEDDNYDEVTHQDEDEAAYQEENEESYEEEVIETAPEGEPGHSMYPMTAAEALTILQSSYPDYTLLGGGSIGYNEYNDYKYTHEPAYMYAFRKEDSVYTGWVFADGYIKFRSSGEYYQE